MASPTLVADSAFLHFEVPVNPLSRPLNASVRGSSCCSPPKSTSRMIVCLNGILRAKPSFTAHASR
jgi:hypothetical protein